MIFPENNNLAII